MFERDIHRALVEMLRSEQASMAVIAGMLNYSLLLAVHFLAVVPLHAARSLWIATKLKLHPDVVSELSCYDAVDLEKLEKSMEKPVVADRSCGHCSTTARQRHVSERLVFMGGL